LEGQGCTSAHLRLLQEKANGGTRFGMSCDDSPAEPLRARNAAPIDCPPLSVLWGQRAIFRLTVDNMPCIVHVNENSDISLHAVDPDKPFVSETGYLSIMDFPHDLRPGDTLAQFCIRRIADAIAFVDDEHGRPKPRKKPMPLPETWYRMPSSWQEEIEGFRGGSDPVEAGSRAEQAEAAE
jgi:hypothetical protein